MVFQEENLKEVEKMVGVFLDKMGFSARLEVEFNGETLLIQIYCDEPSLLIGERGRILSSLQKILKQIICRKWGEDYYFHIDVNNYQRKRIQYLKELAQELADEVSAKSEAREMEPMSSYERRIVHLELSGRSDIVTESAGYGAGRRVVIKPFLS